MEFNLKFNTINIKTNSCFVFQNSHYTYLNFTHALMNFKLISLKKSMRRNIEYTSNFPELKSN